MYMITDKSPVNFVNIFSPLSTLNTSIADPCNLMTLTLSLKLPYFSFLSDFMVNNLKG